MAAHDTPGELTIATVMLYVDRLVMHVNDPTFSKMVATSLMTYADQLNKDLVAQGFLPGTIAEVS